MIFIYVIEAISCTVVLILVNITLDIFRIVYLSNFLIYFAGIKKTKRGYGNCLISLIKQKQRAQMGLSVTPQNLQRLFLKIHRSFSFNQVGLSPFQQIADHTYII